MPVIDVAGVSHAYGEQAGRRVVLFDISVRLTERRIGVIGANGSGKSTFVRLLNGLVLPTTGSVRIDGLDTRKHGREIRRLIGFCFTDPDAQIVMPTVREDVAFGLRRRGLAREEIDARVMAMLTRYGLADHADHPAHLLSGGQKQLLALCSVLVTEPALLVLDEPTTLLDMRNTARVIDVVSELEPQVILVTHQLEQVDGFDRVLVFDDARLVYDGAPLEAMEHYRKLMR